MVRGAWFSIVLALSIVLSGCIAGADSDPPQVEIEPVATVPDGPDWVRVLEAAGGNETTLIGFDLALHEDDWEEDDWYRLTLEIAPFGDLEGWALMIFDDDGVYRSAVNLPHHYVTYPALGEGEQAASSETYGMRLLNPDGPTSYHAVAALVGTGGLAIHPEPGYVWNGDLHSVDELLGMNTATPEILGTGVGMDYDMHADVTIFGALGGQITYGDPVVDYGLNPLPDAPSPLMDLKVDSSWDTPGWTYGQSAYLNLGAGQGLWSATVVADDTYEFDGVVLQHAYAWIAEVILLGLPVVVSEGDTGTPPETTFDLQVVSGDYIEIMLTSQLSLGASMGDLIGAPQGFEAFEFRGLLPTDTAEQSALQIDGNDIVLRHGDSTFTLIGAAHEDLRY